MSSEVQVGRSGTLVNHHLFTTMPLCQISLITMSSKTMIVAMENPWEISQLYLQLGDFSATFDLRSGFDDALHGLSDWLKCAEVWKCRRYPLETFLSVQFLFMMTIWWPWNFGDPIFERNSVRKYLKRFEASSRNCQLGGIPCLCLGSSDKLTFASYPLVI